ncbi:MAG: hypothetical protein HYS13_01225 [Planctomycetia bacterium]|nr:hypothetical protein [Planctomycetia bacterium]
MRGFWIVATLTALAATAGCGLFAPQAATVQPSTQAPFFQQAPETTTTTTPPSVILGTPTPALQPTPAIEPNSGLPSQGGAGGTQWPAYHAPSTGGSLGTGASSSRSVVVPLPPDSPPLLEKGPGDRTARGD